MNIKAIAVSAALLTCLAATLQPALSLEAPVRKVLSNGIPVIVQDTLSSPTVSLNIFIRVGSVHEGPDVNGISHFYEHMFFRGTPRRTGLQFKREIEALGGTTNAATTRDFTHFYINLPKAYTRQGLEILADAYLNAECSLDSVKAEREVVLEEYRLGKSQPARIVHDRLCSLLFPNHPYGRTIIGTEEILNKIGREELVKHKQNYYVPARTNLCIIGDIDRAQVLRDCEELFGKFRASGLPEGEMPVEKPPAETVTITESTRGDQSQIYFAYLGPSVKDKPDVYEVDMLAFLLGHGKSSLLSKGLNGKERKSDVSVEYLTQAYPGMITLSMEVPPGEEAQSIAKADEIIKSVQEGKFTEKDLQRARRQLRNIYSYGIETNSGKADSLGFYETIDTSGFATTYLKEVDKVTPARLAAAAQKYFSRPHYRLVLKAPKKKG